jgi:hypothetical protein
MSQSVEEINLSILFERVRYRKDEGARMGYVQVQRLEYNNYFERKVFGFHWKAQCR